MTAPALLCLGSINADFQLRVDEPPGRAESLAAHDLRRLGGGKAANVAVLTRRLGHAALLLGRIGDDDLAAQAMACVREAGVDCAGVRVGRSAATGVAMIAVPPDGKKRTVASGEANLGFDEGDIAAVEAHVRAAPPQSLLVVNPEVTPRAVSRAIAAAHARGMRVVLDPSFPHAVDRDDMPRVHALTPNVAEALALAGTEGTGDAAILAAAHALARLGPPFVCIKLDDGGCLWLHEGRAWRQRSAPVRVVDTTGAGDAFTGALGVALLEGRAPAQAVRFAVAASELAVTAFGAQPSYPDRARLDEWVERFDRPLTPWER